MRAYALYGIQSLYVDDAAMWTCRGHGHMLYSHMWMRFTFRYRKIHEIWIQQFKTDPRKKM